MESQRPSIGQHYKGFDAGNGRRKPSLEAEDNTFTAALTKSNLKLSIPVPEGHFVRKWLIQTEEDDEAQGIDNKNNHTETKVLRPEDSISSHNAFYQDENLHTKMKRVRRRHTSSSDSSLLDYTISTKLDSRIRYDASDKYGKRDKIPPHLQVKRKAETLDPETPGQRSNQRETFEKRPRRKTRENLYEPKDQKKDSELRSREKRLGTKRVKKGERKIAARRAGEDLMRNFSSEKIAHDRLTFLPSRGLGLFNNGRTSSPKKPRGLPDLASSEMMFLQRLTRGPTTKKPDKASSKSREKERRRVEREQVEISTFFKPRQALVEKAVRYSPRETPSTNISDEKLTSRKQISDSGHEMEHLSLRIPKSKTRGIKLAQPTQFSGTVCTPRGSSRSRQLPRQESGPPCHWPGDGTTCVIWSDTQMTPIAASSSRPQINIRRSKTSPILESIRRSIERTGIFRDTGIELTVAYNPSRETASRDKRSGDAKISSTPSNRNRFRTEESTTLPSILFGSHGQCRVSLKERNCCQGNNQNKKDISHGTLDEHFFSKEHPRGEHPTVESEHAILAPSMTNFVGYSDSIRSTPTPAASLFCSQIPKDYTSSSMTREQIAQKARIRRQSATLPASKATKAEIQLNESEVWVINPNNVDFQEKLNRSNPDNTAVRAECTTTFSKASSNAETGPGSQVQEIMHDVQETVSQENPINTHPSTPVYVTQPATTCPIAEAFDSGCIIADGVAALDHTNQVQASSITANSLTTHPIQEPLRNWIQQPTSQPPYLLPTVEYPQENAANFYDVEHMLYEVDNIGEQCGFSFEDEKNQVASYIGHTGYRLWEDASTTIAMQGGNCIYDRTTNLEGPQGDDDVQPVIPESLDGKEWFTCQELGDSELLVGDLGTDSQIVREIIPGNTTNALYWDRGTNIGYEQANNEVDDALRGFWRPHRTY